MSEQKKTTMVQSQIDGIPLVKRGKVRDVYDLGDALLIVATDRISCFDVVLPTPIPGKGRVLTQISHFWFKKTGHIVPNHTFSGDIDTATCGIPDFEMLRDRSMVVHKAEALPIEAVVRGYLSGSGWKEYQQQGTVCGVALPRGLDESERLPEPIFTPATKAPEGAHDENIPFERMVDIIGADLAGQIREICLLLYTEAAAYAAQRGIIIADTKFEFGLVDGKLTLIDEALTPDSSRFWLMDKYRVGMSPPSFDKQFVRDYLVESGWDKEPPAPELPEDVVRNTSDKYEEALRIITS